MHRSLHHGASVEFAEHKEYAPGDELRHIDWRAYGRIDKYYVKRFEEETELRGYLLLDTSGSMGYAAAGRPSKLDHGKLLCAALGYLLLRQKDQAGVLAFAADVGAYLPPRGHGAHLADLCQRLQALQAPPGGATDLPRALAFLSEVARRRALVVVVSDLLPPPGEGDPALLAEHLSRLRALLSGLRARRHDVVVLQVLDPDELDLPFEGSNWFEDLEPGGAGRLLVDPADVRRIYRDEVQAFLAQVKRSLQENDVEYRLTLTSEPPQDALLDLLRGPLRGKLRR